MYYILSAIYDPPRPLETSILIKTGPLWAWQGLWGYGRKVHAKFWPLGDALGPEL